MHTISNTEVAMFNTCQRSHYYRFRLDIEPRWELLSRALKRGIIGHEALEAYYTVLKNGGSTREAQEAAIEVIHQKVKDEILRDSLDTKPLDDLKQLKGLLMMYPGVYKTEPFEVIEVEAVHKVKVNETTEYGLRLDLLVQFTKGEYFGDLALIDHKFIYNFKTPAELAMDAQLVKYGQTLRSKGFKVTKGYFNQVRTRQLKDPAPTDLFRRVMVQPTHRETERIWAEQAIVAERIATLKAMPREDHSDAVSRNLNPLVCRSCLFQMLCKAEMGGDPIKNMLVAHYQRNTYGYSTSLGEE
jgi:hypothetical protein